MRMNNTTSLNTTAASMAANGQTCIPSEPVNRELQITLYSLLVLVSAIGNSMVIFVVIRNKRMHTVANYLICNMSFADLLITLLPLVWEVIKLIHYPNGEWPMGRFMCTFVHMAIYLSVASSILSLFAITWDRFFAIVLPLRQIFTKKILPFLLVFIWVAAFGFASPTIYAMDLFEYYGTTYCIEIWKPPFNEEKSAMHYTVVLFLGLYAIPLSTMAVMYSIMAYKLWKRIIPGNSSAETEKQLLKQKKRVTRMLVLVVLAFAVCWLPIFVYQFMVFVDPYYKICVVSIPQSFTFFAFFMQYMGSAVNPYIYFKFSEAYRKGLKNALLRGKVQPEFTQSLRVQSRNRRTSTMPTIDHKIISMATKNTDEKVREDKLASGKNNNTSSETK